MLCAQKALYLPLIDGNVDTMNIEQVREFALSLMGVTEDMPFGDDVVVFRVEGKIFLCLRLTGDERRFAIKLSPERNEALRAAYEEVTPAWHWNKKHWSDVRYEHGIAAESVKAWISESYRLIIAKLPQRVRQKYQ